MFHQLRRDDRLPKARDAAAVFVFSRAALREEDVDACDSK